MGLFSRRNTPDDSETPTEPVENEEKSEELPEEDAPPQTRHASARMFDTALGAGSRLEGDLSSDGNVRLDGYFKGKLTIEENVLIGVTAEIEADVNAKNVSIAGVVRGDVGGSKVHLLSTAKVWGNITAGALITEDGAFIDGRISMTNDDSNADDPPPLLGEPSGDSIS
jgi:cytoskeletal protein CcmA (bactofilin family)